MSENLTVEECYEIFATSFAQFRFREDIESAFLRNLRIELGLEERLSIETSEDGE